MLVPACVFLLSSCSSSTMSLDASGTVEGRYAKASEYYIKEDYDDAALELEPVIFTSRATALEDDVLFLLGQSYYKSKQYLLAVDMYTRLLQQVPSSPMARQAQFQLAKSHERLSTHFELDHEHTVKAIQQYALYLEIYPGRDSTQISSDAEMYRELLKVNPDNQSYKDKYALVQEELKSGQSQSYAENAIRSLREKLAKNTYFIARQYIQLKKYKAAGIYYDEVIKRYPDTGYSEQAWKGKIDVLIKRKKWFEADQTLDRYLQLYPDKQNEMQNTRDRIIKNFSNA
jgi:outer membrane protein assembly factor BamD